MNKLAIWVFFGAVWGILEASLGYMLHWTPFPVAGMIMFPIGFFLMKMAMESAEDMKSILYVSWIAAGIKLVNLPFVPIWMVAVNPAIAIVFEGLFVYVAIRLINHQSIKAAVASFGWRFTYIIYLLVLSSFGLKIVLFNGGMIAVVRYLTLDGFVGAVLVIMLSKVKDIKLQNIRFWHASVVGALAIYLTLVI